MRRVRSENPKAKGSGGVVLSAVGTAPEEGVDKSGVQVMVVEQSEADRN